MNCSSPGSSVHGILQARILERVAVPFSGGSSWPRDRTQVSRIMGRSFTIWATPEPRRALILYYYSSPRSLCACMLSTGALSSWNTLLPPCFIQLLSFKTQFRQSPLPSSRLNRVSAPPEGSQNKTACFYHIALLSCGILPSPSTSPRVLCKERLSDVFYVSST